MPRKKLKLTVSQESIDKLEKALEAGSPLHIALQFAGISSTTYYYWVAMYSIALSCKAQDELKDLKADKFGVSIETIKDIAAEESAKKQSSLGAFIEPSAESLMQYRNQKEFRDFADQCYEIIKECNEVRAKAALGHLAMITKSVSDKRVNASGSMWFLERTYSDFFAKPSDKVKEEDEKKAPVDKVVIEFVDANKKADKDRIQHMEELILREQKGLGES